MPTATHLRVELPVCRICGHIGKLPAHITRKDYCAGGVHMPHKAVKMQKRLFIEAPAAEQKVGV